MFYMPILPDLLRKNMALSGNTETTCTFFICVGNLKHDWNKLTSKTNYIINTKPS